MGKTPRQLEQELSSAEWSELLALNQVFPLDDAYWIGAQICQVIAASLGGSKGFAVEDFIPRPKEAPRRLTPEESAGATKRLLQGF